MTAAHQRVVQVLKQADPEGAAFRSALDCYLRVEKSPVGTEDDLTVIHEDFWHEACSVLVQRFCGQWSELQKLVKLLGACDAMELFWATIEGVALEKEAFGRAIERGERLNALLTFFLGHRETCRKCGMKAEQAKREIRMMREAFKAYPRQFHSPARA